MPGFCFVLAVGVFLRLPSSLFSDPTSCFHRPESLHPQAGFSDNAEVNSALGELRQVQSKPGEAKQFLCGDADDRPHYHGALNNPFLTAGK